MSGLVESIFGSTPTPQAPNYAPVAAASDHAAQLGYDLGQQQLAQAQAQYQQNMAVAQPVVQAQLAQMQQNQQQGQDYYNYMVANQRPLQQAIAAQAQRPDLASQQAQIDAITNASNAGYGQVMGLQNQLYGQNQLTLADINRMNQANAAAMLGSNAQIQQGQYGQDIEQQAGQAAAAARQGSTAQMNQLIRQGLRYGYSGDAMAQRLAPQALQQGLGVAAAQNQARQAATANARALLGQQYQLGNANALQNYQLTNQNAAQQMGALTANTQATVGALSNARQMGIQNQAVNWGRMMDASGLYAGMPGASQGAYSLATGAGNSALANQMQPGNALMSGMAQGAGMQQYGAAQQLQGLTGIMGSQGNIYGQNLQAQSQNAAGLGQLVGSGLGAYMGYLALAA